MFNSGIVFALLTALSWSICIFPFTQAARRLGSNSLNHFRLLLAMLIMGLISLLAYPDEFRKIFSSEYLNEWCWLGISGVVGLTIGDYFAFVMYSILGARIGSILTTFAPAAALILGALLIDERIPFIGIVGMIITVTGVNYVSLGKSEREKIPDRGHGTITKGIVAGILGALCQGAGLVLAKKGIISVEHEQINPVHATFIRLSAAVVSIYLFSIITGRIREALIPVFQNRNGGIKYGVAGTIFGPVLGVCFSLYAVSSIDPSVAQTIFSLVPVFALLLAATFLKDKITRKSLLGLFLAIAGVIVLIWRDRIKDFF